MEEYKKYGYVLGDGKVATSHVCRYDAKGKDLGYHAMCMQGDIVGPRQYAKSTPLARCIQNLRVRTDKDAYKKHIHALWDAYPMIRRQRIEGDEINGSVPNYSKSEMEQWIWNNPDIIRRIGCPKLGMPGLSQSVMGDDESSDDVKMGSGGNISLGSSIISTGSGSGSPGSQVSAGRPIVSIDLKEEKTTPSKQKKGGSPGFKRGGTKPQGSSNSGASSLPRAFGANDTKSQGSTSSGASSPPRAFQKRQTTISEEIEKIAREKVDENESPETGSFEQSPETVQTSSTGKRDRSGTVTVKQSYRRSTSRKRSKAKRSKSRKRSRKRSKGRKRSKSRKRSKRRRSKNRKRSKRRQRSKRRRSKNRKQSKRRRSKNRKRSKRRRSKNRKRSKSSRKGKRRQVYRTKQ